MTQNDDILQQLKIFITNGWLKQKSHLTGENLSYWSQNCHSKVNAIRNFGKLTSITHGNIENKYKSKRNNILTKHYSTYWNTNQEMWSLSHLFKTATERTSDSRWYSYLCNSNRGFRSIQLEQSRFCNSGGLLRKILGDRKIVRHKINNNCQEDEENVFKTWNTWNNMKWQWTSTHSAGV